MASLAGGRTDAVFARALLEARAPLHLGYRLMLRFQQLFSVDNAGAVGLRWQLAILGFAVLDVAVWAVLRRSNRFGLWWRLPLDALDVTLFSLAPPPANPSYDLAVLIGFPLAMEAGVRRGARGLVVLPGLLAVIGPARLFSGRPVAPFTLLFLALAVGMGAAIMRYCQRLQARADLERDRLRAAEYGRDVLAGQNAVAMGASSVVDTIEGLVPLLGPPPPGSALADLADGWKTRLGASTSATATYLQVALLQWERDHNRHPDLSGLVTVRLAEGAGTTLLTANQVGALRASFDRLVRRGAVAVSLAGPVEQERPPGAGLTLLVGGRTVAVPPDMGPDQRPVDPGPVIFLFAAVLTVRDLVPAFGGVPAWAVGLGVTAMLGGGRWAHHHLMARGPLGRRRVVVVATAIAIGYAALAGATLGNPVNAIGARLYPIGGAAYLPTLLAGLYRRELSRRVWELMGLALATLFSAHLILRLPASIRPMDVVLLASWPLSVLPTAVRVSRSISRANEEVAAQARGGDSVLAAAAFRAGRASVIDLVARAHDEAREQLATARDLDPSLAQVAHLRLEEVERRLAAMSPAAALSSSTTTT